MKNFFILFITGLLFIQSSYSQRKETFKAYEDSIINLHRQVLMEENAIAKYQKNESLLYLVEEALSQRNSINYPFDSLKTMSVLISPDKKVRLFTWYLVDDEGFHDHFGYIQAYNEVKKRYMLYPLTDKWKQIILPENKRLDHLSWYGAVYYQIIKTETYQKTYYTLLGWNGGSIFSQFKVIDVLSFNNRGYPVFGAFLFRSYGRSKPMRIIFEYAKKSSLNLRYEKQGYTQKSKKIDRRTKRYRIDTLYTTMIIFDRLIPMDEKLPDVPQFRVGESSLNDGFLEKEGKWYFKEGVIGRNPDKPLPKYEYKPKDLYRKTKN